MLDDREHAVPRVVGGVIVSVVERVRLTRYNECAEERGSKQVRNFMGLRKFM
jgi:hypothetical protein